MKKNLLSSKTFWRHHVRPRKATIKGNSFNIPSQTFQGKSMTIEIFVSGTPNGSKLTFDYTIKADDDYVLEDSCDATKQQYVFY